jgi:hypothetical protein
MIEAPQKSTAQQFDEVVMTTRAYFILTFPDGMRAAGTREMIFRYVCSKCGHVPPVMISAALKILKDRGAIVFENRVWWFMGDR